MTKTKETIPSANCPNCGMKCEKHSNYYSAGKQYDHFHCYECKKPFHILVAGVSFNKLINQ